MNLLICGIVFLSITFVAVIAFLAYIKGNPVTSSKPNVNIWLEQKINNLNNQKGIPG